MKIALVGNSLFTLINFRENLIEKLILRGFKVVLFFPENIGPKYSHSFEKLRNMDVQFYTYNLSRKGLNPFKDLRTIIELYKLYKTQSIDIVLNYTVKPNIYSSISAHFAGVKKIYSNITGLGYAFTGDTFKQKIIKKIICNLYCFSLKLNNKVFFQNTDDRDDFFNMDLISKDKAVLINGSGVDLEKIHLVNKNKIQQSFVFVGRLLKDKGIVEFIEAAKIVSARYPKSSFHIIGAIDDNPNSLDLKAIKSYEEEKIINYYGEVDEVKELLEKFEVFVLPSYREGTPRSTLEAMALNMPIITTDVPGCRETVVEEKNGFLVPLKNVRKLVESIEFFLKNPDKIESYGMNSRELCEEKFDVIKVNNKIIDVISER